MCFFFVGCKLSDLKENILFVYNNSNFNTLTDTILWLICEINTQTQKNKIQVKRIGLVLEYNINHLTSNYYIPKSVEATDMYIVNILQLCFKWMSIMTMILKGIVN